MVFVLTISVSSKSRLTPEAWFAMSSVCEAGVWTLLWRTELRREEVCDMRRRERVMKKVSMMATRSVS